MSAQPPTLIAIDRDDYYASRVGQTVEGRQFFVAQPFVPALGNEPGREFLTVYLFDKDGELLEARIDDLGTRAALNRDQARRLLEERMAELGPVKYGRTQVQPFAIERLGTTFGLIPRPPEEEGDSWWVDLQPGNYMAFHEPWDSGEFDT